MSSTDSVRNMIDCLSNRAGLPALTGSGLTLRCAELVQRTGQQQALMHALDVRVLATLGDNSPEWVVSDLAALLADRVHVPLPGFFSQAQRQAVIQACGADTLAVAAHAYDAGDWPGFALVQITHDGWHWLKRHVAPVAIHPGTHKITFTSGSTGQPKGVCLSGKSMLDVAASVASATAPLGLRRHLNALPFPVLLENVAGLYAALLQGTQAFCLPPEAIGLQGASGFDPVRFHRALHLHDIDSVILLPQMLKHYVTWLQQQGAHAPPSLRYVAVGGAPVGQEWLRQAHELGVPAYEGYGLSEGGSVQTVNLPGACRFGSVGKALPHTRLKRAVDGEILISGTTCLGYLGQPAQADQWLPTGDLGLIDDDGYVYLRGRKKNVLITGYGRNVSPEWVETHLHDQPEIAVAVVLGDGQPALAAVVWPRHQALTDQQIQHAIDRANEPLPLYARIGHWCRATHAYLPESGVCTSNGRPVRAAISALYNETLFPACSPDSSVDGRLRVTQPDLTEMS